MKPPFFISQDELVKKNIEMKMNLLLTFCSFETYLRISVILILSDIIYHWIQAEGNSVLEILGQKLESAELDGKL